MKLLNALSTLVMLAASSAAVASTLPLKRGDYVVAAQQCRDAPFAAMTRYDGKGFSGPHASQCVSTVLSHAGRDYRVRTTCSALGDGTHARPSSTLERYVVTSPTSFTRRAASGNLIYRLCRYG